MRGGEPPKPPEPSSAVRGFLVANFSDLSLLAGLLLLGGILQLFGRMNASLLTGLLVLAALLIGRLAERLRAAVQGDPGASASPAELDSELAEKIRLLTQENRKLEAAKQRIETALHATVDPLVARMIIDRRLHNEKRPLSVLFADLEDFTAVSERTPPELVVGQLNELFSEMEPVLSSFKGHIDKYLGDGLMAEFGAPYSAHHHPVLAVLAALHMQQRMRAGRFPWRMRIGIATGTLLVGLMGSEHRRNYTAVGDTVNLAARLQGFCPPGSVCVDENVQQFVKRWFRMRRILTGLSSDAAQDLEKTLERLTTSIERKPSATACLEAAAICAQLGNMAKSMRYHKMALELDPWQRRPIEQAVTSAIMTGQERAHVNVKGKAEGVVAYEVLGLKDLWADKERLPKKAHHVYRWIEAEVDLPNEWMLSIEALEGRLGHAQVTAALSGAIADSLGFDNERVQTAFLAGYFNDVGKKNVPEHLLCYAGRLQDLPRPDQELVRGHVQEAEKVLREIGVPTNPEMLEAILHHHERFDGAGYPNGLKGDRISLIGRIVKVADTYEALTSWRMYQDALAPSAALVELCRDLDGGAIDPKIGQVFLELMSPL